MREQETGYQIGKDIHVAGFDNIEVSHYLHPRLTTIGYSKRKWGALASEQLLKLIRNELVEDERVYVSLVEGESVCEA
ncbi:hypothetical protein GKZ89_08640 [Bacillus mangrovi]|uniref:Transcriptional regulator LacI/GalR-like sensor domain-containing protein n=1 Tax=Metabacillus mangrovi TaxID=1491830 RepID=A0A7X2S4F2_9BACI|nr:hypothetical protein [Metabacillus mangrovi]